MLTAHNSRVCFAAPCQQNNIYFFCVRKKNPEYSVCQFITTFASRPSRPVLFRLVGGTVG